MRGISRYARVSLWALGVFLLGIFGYFLTHRQADVPYAVETAVNPAQVQTVQPDASAQEPVPEDPGKPDSLLEGEKININTAPAADLCRLPGIGEKRAQAILDYREEHGPFASLEELMEVSGIGPGIFAGVQDYITID